MFPAKTVPPLEHFLSQEVGKVARNIYLFVHTYYYSNVHLYVSSNVSASESVQVVHWYCGGKYFWSPSIYLSSGQTIHSLLLSICSLFIHKLKIFSKTRTKMFSHISENIFIRLCIKLCCLENWWSCFLSTILRNQFFTAPTPSKS